MNEPSLENERVLAIDPFSCGFGFAVLEGPKNLIDWGVKDLVHKVVPSKLELNGVCVKAVEGLIKLYQPDAITLEDTNGERSRRCARVRWLIKRIIYLAEVNKIKVFVYSPSDMRKHFLQFGANNKHKISNKIAAWFPELLPHRPPFRKPWMTEDSRMSIFDAVAMAITFYAQQKKADTLPVLDEKAT